MVGLNATSVLVPKPEVKANITKESATTYKVTITDVPIYIDDIQVPTWTEANGQDDLQWYKAEKAADGSYYVVFSEAPHNLEAGTYNVHVYGYNHVKKYKQDYLANALNQTIVSVMWPLRQNWLQQVSTIPCQATSAQTSKLTTRFGQPKTIKTISNGTKWVKMVN